MKTHVTNSDGIINIQQQLSPMIAFPQTPEKLATHKDFLAKNGISEKQLSSINSLSLFKKNAELNKLPDRAADDNIINPISQKFSEQKAYIGRPLEDRVGHEIKMPAFQEQKENKENKAVLPREIVKEPQHHRLAGTLIVPGGYVARLEPRRSEHKEPPIADVDARQNPGNRQNKRSCILQ